jgi:hypothetical protein
MSLPPGDFTERLQSLLRATGPAHSSSTPAASTSAPSAAATARNPAAQQPSASVSGPPAAQLLASLHPTVRLQLLLAQQAQQRQQAELAARVAQIRARDALQQQLQQRLRQQGIAYAGSALPRGSAAAGAAAAGMLRPEPLVAEAEVGHGAAAAAVCCYDSAGTLQLLRAVEFAEVLLCQTFCTCRKR